MPNLLYASITLYVLFLYLFKIALEKTGSISRYYSIKRSPSISRAVVLIMSENCMTCSLLRVALVVVYFYNKIIDMFLFYK